MDQPFPQPRCCGPRIQNGRRPRDLDFSPYDLIFELVRVFQHSMMLDKKLATFTFSYSFRKHDEN